MTRFIMTALILTGAIATTYAGGNDNPKEKTCIERTYDKERNRGTDHKESRERAKEVCRDAGRSQDK